MCPGLAAAKPGIFYGLFEEDTQLSEAKITWYGHACFKVELAGSSIVLDPYGACVVPGLWLPDLTADAVHVSHAHQDHSASSYVELTGRTLNFALREVMSYHDHDGGAHRGENRILVMEGEGLRIVHMGDQGCTLTRSQIDEIGRPDLLMVPVGGFCTVDAREARQIAGQLDARVVVPMHYRDGAIGYDVIDTVDAFLEGQSSVVHSDSPSFVLTEQTPAQILIPKLVQ